MNFVILKPLKLTLNFILCRGVEVGGGVINTLNNWETCGSLSVLNSNLRHFLDQLEFGYSQLSLRRTPSGPASSVCLRDMSGL